MELHLTPEELEKLTKLQEIFKLDSLENTVKHLLFNPEKVDDKYSLAVKVVSLLDPTVDIASPSRNESAFLYRCVVSEYLRSCGYTYTKIGKLLNRDHSSISYFKRVADDANEHPIINKPLILRKKAFYEKLNELSKLNEE